MAKKLAAFYIAYLEPEIQSYVLNIKRKNFKYFGENVIFKGGGEIFHEENISIYNHVRIGRDYFLMGIGGIEIGEGTIISRNVCIHSGNHDFKSEDYLPYNTTYIKNKITIGKGVWIGQNVNILPGVTIGDGAIIGMGTTVAKDVAKGEIVVGGAFRSIGFRSSSRLEELIANGKYISKTEKNI
ncbi:DapH/DapD/GlmU-related protein [Flavobacterium sp. J27]|uniref:acyltransferase n=1 Tax=Flavobacterium sp. J27 TaxID=2060419 RepID=UPI00272BA966|nr:acyltransferase [Flavobacterium sp. J27]